MKKVRQATSTRSVDFLKNKEKTVRGKYAIKIMALSRYIEAFKNSDNFKQKEIADNLEMAESQLSKWLSGFHNLTLQSILKLESASHIEILNPSIWNGTSIEKIKGISTPAQEVEIPGTDINQDYARNSNAYIASINSIKTTTSQKPSPLVVAYRMVA